MSELVPASWLVRPDTWDGNIYDAVYTLNEYNVPEQLDGNVVDIGCHIGSFSARALDSGAGLVLAYEANPENLAMACHNLNLYDNFVPHLSAVWRSDRFSDELRYRPHPNRLNTGGGDIFAVYGDRVLKTVGLDDIIREVSYDGLADSEIDLLKLDCEGSEYPILYTSKLLDSVQAIVGEWHLEKPKRFCEDLPDFTPSALVAFLRGRGFEADWTTDPNSTIVGKFWAHR